MDSLLNIILFLIVMWLLITVLYVILTYYQKYRAAQHIRTLWDTRSKSENFIRPNQHYRYQYDTYQPRHKHTLDDKTWSDLNLDDLFQQLNFNFTAIGEMRLYAALRGMFKINNQKLINSFKHQTSFRQSVSVHLSQIGKTIYPMFPDQIKPIKMHRIYYLCPLLPLIGLILIPILKGPGLLFFLFAIVLNIVLSGKLSKHYSEYINATFYSVNVIKKAERIHKLEYAPNLKVNFKHFTKAKRFSPLLGKVSPDNEGGAIAEFIKLAFMLDYVIFNSVQNTFTQHQDELMACYDYVSEIDNHYAIALWQETLDSYTHPQITKQPELQFESLVHPLLETPVPNDLNIKRNILLTGSNASGKSTFMKAVAFNLVLAQTVNTALAHQFKYKPGMILTSMANQDDVLSGDSYFIAELKSILRLMQQADIYCYCFIDEIFKGTNTTERIAASQSVLNYLAAHPNNRIVAATHDIELSQLLENDFDNYHFNETIKDDEIHFDYKIKPGKADTRNAIELLRLMDFPKTVYQNALQQSSRRVIIN
ncbi:MutS-related protein [Staphylococcus simulans]